MSISDVIKRPSSLDRKDEKKRLGLCKILINSKTAWWNNNSEIPGCNNNFYKNN